MIFDWMLFLELTLKTALITNVFSKALCSTPSKNLFFSKLGILNRSYGSLKQNLHYSSVVHQHSAVLLPVLDFLKTIEGEVFQISSGKMLLLLQVGDFLGTSVLTGSTNF